MGAPGGLTPGSVKYKSNVKYLSCPGERLQYPLIFRPENDLVSTDDSLNR